MLAQNISYIGLHNFGGQVLALLYNITFQKQFKYELLGGCMWKQMLIQGREKSFYEILEVKVQW